MKPAKETMLRPISIIQAGAAAIAIGLALAGVAHAQDKTTYQGAQITIAVASTAGGGYDSYARMVARHLGKHVPGNPTIVVTNMSGAGGNVVGRYLSNAAPKDGTYIALVLPGTVTGGLYLDKAKLQYDPSRLSHLGSANSEIDMCFVRSDAGVKTLADVREKEVILGGSAEGGATREQPAVLNALIGTRFKIVSGYPGTREIIIAIERKRGQRRLRHELLGDEAAAPAMAGERLHPAAVAEPHDGQSRADRQGRDAGRRSGALG